MVKQRPYSYTSVFENIRVMGKLLAPSGMAWETELPTREQHLPFVMHLSCMAHTTPHVAYIAQQALNKLGIECPIVGGPENCCGSYHWHFGDTKMATQSATIAAKNFRRARPTTVLSICPSCDESFAKLPEGQKRFHHANVSELFISHLDQLSALMRPLRKRIVLHTHGNNESRRNDAENIRRILSAIPELEILDAPSAFGPGSDCNQIEPMPSELQERMFADVKNLGADYFVVPYHSCYRQYCKQQLKREFEVHHYLGLLGMSLGIAYQDPFKELRLLDDIDKAVDTLLPRITEMGYNPADVKEFLTYSIYC